MADVLNEFRILQRVSHLPNLHGEDFLSNQVAQYLKVLTLEEKLEGVWFHVPNESVVGDRMDIVRIKRKQCLGMINGAPDFIITTRSKTIFIELKTDKGRQTESQKMFEKWSSKHNIAYSVCRSLDEVSQVLKKEGVI